MLADDCATDDDADGGRTTDARFGCTRTGDELSLAIDRRGSHGLTGHSDEPGRPGRDGRR
jgi:hypothetical protein